PRRRNRLPSAKCNSVVSGSSLATSTNASMALSGSSFNKKLSPLKYEFGKERVSESICRISTPAATQPSANNRGRKISHHGSKSTLFNLGASYRGANGATVSGATAAGWGLG